MSEQKLCPYRFREFADESTQECIGERCKLFWKCDENRSQSHGEPRTDTVETQTRVCTETDAETAQEPREVYENANDEDTREKLEADMLDAGCADEIDYDRIIGWLDRQAAITERECAERLNFKTITAVANELNVDLQAQLDKLSSDELHWHSEADYWKRQYELICKAVEDVARNYTVVDEDGEVVS